MLYIKLVNLLPGVKIEAMNKIAIKKSTRSMHVAMFSLKMYKQYC